MPKNVDELRVANNQKESFDLIGHQGPAISAIKVQGQIGKIEKHLPEKYHEVGPTRWFTTTGAEQAPAIRPTQVIPMENRIDTTREYYGGGGQAQTTYVNSEIEESKRQGLGPLPFSNATLEVNHRLNQGIMVIIVFYQIIELLIVMKLLLVVFMVWPKLL